MRRAIVLQHVPFEGPALLAPRLEARGYALDLRRLDLGEAVPERLGPGELLVVMGGPMGVADLGRPELPFLAEERALLGRCIEDDAPVLGVCLGAQLLAHAAGAEVYPMREPDGRRRYELGWAPLTLHPSGPDDPILAGLPEAPMVLHWHGDMFALPAGARRLASTPRCENQAFQLGARMFGLQFHCEVGAAEVARFAEEDAAFVTEANGPGGLEALHADTARHIDGARAAGDLLLAKLFDAMER